MNKNKNKYYTYIYNKYSTLIKVEKSFSSQYKMYKMWLEYFSAVFCNLI